MVKRNRRASLRMTAADEAALGRLAKRVRLDRSKTLRALVRLGTRLLHLGKLKEFDFHG